MIGGIRAGGVAPARARRTRATQTPARRTVIDHVSVVMTVYNGLPYSAMIAAFEPGLRRLRVRHRR
jgi:hypothetical protein